MSGFFQQKKTKSNLIFMPLAYTMGALGSWVYEISSGAATALHEIVGHGLLGLGVTSSRGGAKPDYWVSGFDKVHDMQHAHTPGSAISSFFNWFFTPQQSKQGAVGLTTHGANHPNTLGDHLGPHGTSAWISITGSIPGLLVNTSCVVTAMFLRKKHPNIALGLATFGVTNSITEGAYAWDAATMNHTQLHTAATHGHDFANFAIQMSAISGLNASAIACATACFWTGFIPLVALGIYFYQQSHQTDIVSDRMALRQWLTVKSENKNLVDTLYQAYYGKPFNKKQSPSDLTPEFIDYVIKHIPDNELLAAKKAILQQWQQLQNPSKLEKILGYSTITLIFLGVVEQILALLAHTIAPALLPAVTVLQVILPFLGLISVLSSAYETHKDLQCPDTQVPRWVKAISVLKLLITTTMVTCMMVAIFMPGLQFAFLPVALIGTLMTLGLSFAKIKMLQPRIAASSEMFRNTRAEETISRHLTLEHRVTAI